MSVTVTVPVTVTVTVTVNDSKSAGRLTLVYVRGNRSPRRLWQLRRICSTAVVRPHRDCDRTDPGPVIPNNVTIY
jgi:hypothetical protein